jgi:hypothetical protein
LLLPIFNTNVNVYIKAQHASDPIQFELNNWIQLEVVEGTSVYSSSSNLNDFKEFVYKLPESSKVSDVFTYSNSSGVYSGYRKFAIKIEFAVDQIGTPPRTPIGTVPRLLDYRAVALT